METPHQPPELPELDTAIHLLESEERADVAIHALTMDAVLQQSGPAYWVDVRGYARIRPLARIAPDNRALKRIQIARGFTPWQHLALVRRLRTVATNASLVVLPAFDAVYRDDDLRGDEPTEMLVHAIAAVAQLARDHDVPVLMTRYQADELSQPVLNAADRTLKYEETAHGPRFIGEEFETLVYPHHDGTVQTTFAFWKQVLQERSIETGTQSSAMGSQKATDGGGW